MVFQERVETIIQRKDSLLCVGLDTVAEKIPSFLSREEDPLFAFNRAIIDATADIAAAFKINTAFYEAYGLEGWRALEKTFDYLPDSVLKIADAKRGDIGNSSAMYARAFFESLGADAMTVNPLMGHDAVAPFIQNPEKGVFILCLTSNPGSRDLQYLSDGQYCLYEKIARLIDRWNVARNCGLVAGATHPEDLKRIRRLADVPFLIPGLGAQGGNLVDSVQNGTDEAGGNALFNSSRGIIYASSGQDFARVACEQAEKMRVAINRARTLKIRGSQNG